MAIFNKTEDKKNTKKSTAAASMKDLYGSEGAAKTKEPAKAVVGKDRKFGNAYRVLLKPLVTEKASVAGAENKYIFHVAPDANKVEVAKSIKEVYGVKPTKVNIVTVLGKKSRYGKTSGKRKDWKKAIVTLPAGQSIKVYEGV